nr:unnamed protein product [Callosobruchus chinensis]CAI5850227.1 unnamed protein product [Callosobruchus analis]CAH7726433.1 unnamed protein product [Callosobruchus chinensis]CAH7740987.1 unnamed protein product [Callosobruchus chinensis]CAH7751189.1 unnamed protein product [Callosobruchus chinensis]
MAVSRKRQRFSDLEDLLLLREVLSLNPFEDPDLWLTVQQHISSTTGKLFSVRTLKEHLDLLVKLWIEHVKVLKDK